MGFGFFKAGLFFLFHIFCASFLQLFIHVMFKKVHVCFDLFLIAVVRRVVEFGSHQTVRQILLLDIVIRIIVGILVIYASCARR